MDPNKFLAEENERDQQEAESNHNGQQSAEVTPDASAFVVCICRGEEGAILNPGSDKPDDGGEDCVEYAKDSGAFRGCGAFGRGGRKRGSLCRSAEHRN